MIAKDKTIKEKKKELINLLESVLMDIKICDDIEYEITLNAQMEEIEDWNKSIRYSKYNGWRNYDITFILFAKKWRENGK